MRLLDEMMKYGVHLRWDILGVCLRAGSGNVASKRCSFS